MQSAKKNVLYQACYQILTIIIPIITAPYVARVLGKSGIGIYTYTYSIASYFALFAKLGIHVYGNRAIASVRDDSAVLNKVFSELLFLHISASVLALVAYGFFILHFLSDYKEIVIIQALYIVAEMLEIDWFYFGLEQFKLTVSRNILVKILTLIAIFLFVRTPNDTWKYCAILAVSAAMSQIIVWHWLPNYAKVVKISISEALKHLRPLIGFFIPSVAVSLYKIMDKIMLGAMLGTDYVGLYENSEKIIIMILSVIASLGTVMMPRVTNLIAKGNYKDSIKIIDLSIKFNIVISFSFAFGIMGISEIFIPIFYGNGFIDSAPLMSGLAITMPFIALADVIRTQYLLPNHKDRIFQISVITGACINIMINYFLIPRINALGAVIGTIFAEVSVCAIQCACSWKQLRIGKYIKLIVVSCLCGLIMSILVYTVGKYLLRSILTIIIQVFTGMLTYSILMFIYLYKTQDSLWNEIMKLLKIHIK